MKPRISIVTIAFNSAATIEETIRSVVSQDYDNLEYIVVDGASTDATMDIVGRYREQIDKVVSEPDSGISDAFNKGIALATGDIIGLINSDDTLLPGALSRLAEHFDGETDVYRCSVLTWNPESGAMFREVPAMRFPVIPVHVKVAHQGTFVTPEAYRKYGAYDTSIRYPMDLELLRRFYRLGARMKRVDVDIARYRFGGATSDSIFRKRNDYMRLVLLNGGNRLHAYAYWTYLVCFNRLKWLANIFLGEDFKRRLKYGTLKTQR
ncbi:MAG: glycosyltransferase [Bacteroidaceae bacterium]|nr:glycosyltransferase [Bacteroidaceae bacterium]